jgi:hypothetical protein
MMAPVVGSGGFCVWREAGVRRSVLCWCVWEESGLSDCQYVFSHLINFKTNCYQYRTFNVICKDNSAIYCIIFQHKKIFMPVNSNGPHARLRTLINVRAIPLLLCRLRYAHFSLKSNFQSDKVSEPFHAIPNQTNYRIAKQMKTASN